MFLLFVWFLSTFLLYGTSKYSILNLYTFSPSPRISLLCKEPQFSLLANGIRNQYLGAMSAHWYWSCYCYYLVVRADRAWKIIAYTILCIYICVYKSVCNHLYTKLNMNSYFDSAFNSKQASFILLSLSDIAVLFSGAVLLHTSDYI